jgi:hypothetical protein
VFDDGILSDVAKVAPGCLNCRLVVEGYFVLSGERSVTRDSHGITAGEVANTCTLAAADVSMFP